MNPSRVRVAYRRSHNMDAVNSQAPGQADPAALKLATFASLVNQKFVLLSSSSDYVAVQPHFFDECLRPLISRIRFDERWYLDRYFDVRRAIEKKMVRDAKDHYERYGYFEHRLPYRIQVRENWYLEQYPDVKEAIG